MITTAGNSGANAVTIGCRPEPAREGFVYQNATSGTTTINASVTCGTALVIAGLNTVNLGGTNTYTGGTYQNAGTLQANNTNLGVGVINFNGGNFNPTGTISIANPIRIFGLMAFGANQTNLLGDTTLINNVSLIGNSTVAFQGRVLETGGARSLTVVGSGTVILNNANNYSGGTILVGGTLQLGYSSVTSGAVVTASAVGTGALTLACGTGANLNSNVAVILTNPVIVPNAGVNTINTANHMTFAGPMTLIGNANLNITGAALTQFTGTISGSGALNLTGTQVVSIAPASGVNTYTGGTYLGGAILMFANDSALGTGALVVNSGTIFGQAGQTSSKTLILGGTGATATFNGIVSNPASANPLTFNGPVYLTNNLTLTVFNATQFNGFVSESGGARTLTMAGAGYGTLSLNGAGFYSGVTTLNAVAASGVNILGTLAVGSGSAIGSGALTLTTGVLAASNTAVFLNAVNLNSNNQPVAFAGSPMVFVNTITETNSPLVLVANSTTWLGLIPALTGRKRLPETSTSRCPARLSLLAASL